MGRISIPMMGFVVLCLWAVVAEGEYMKYKDPKQPLGVRIKDLLKRMTVEEKIGQMTQIERKVAIADIMKQNFIEDTCVGYVVVNSVSQSARSGAESKSTGKKRKTTDGNEGMYELLGSFCRSAEARLGDIAKRIGYEYDLSNSRKEVYDVVGNIPGISGREQLAVSKLLVKNTEYLELFSGLPPAAKLEFVRDLLHGDM